MIQRKAQFSAFIAIAVAPQLIALEGPKSLPTLYIDAQQTANSQPVATYESPVSNLEFEPRVDLQSRNMAESQGDVSIRGGIFEGTGFRVGSATLIDPQTGHYFAELPIAPEMLERPQVLTGTDNALYGFNSTAGTISYSWSGIADGGSLTAGAGDHDLNFQRIHHALTGPIGESGDWSWGVEAEFSRSESDGTIRGGDHDFDRTTGRVQILGPASQTDFFVGYQAKFFGWPGMYTAERFANPTAQTLPPEYENLKTRLFVINHRQNYGDGNFVELTATHRRHTDKYLLDATDYTPFPFEFVADHETKATSAGFSGFHRLDPAMAINYGGQITSDEIASTSLEEGDFTSRTYTKLTLLPEYQLKLSGEQSLTVRIGASLDDSNRDDSEISLISDITWERVNR
ncbi:MAG: TonB-dependent receptor, partial [Verrucomicrobia bacterium]|nr:TonB-dependent receptor [Verrucomicrobiota bacterium]